MCSLAYTCFPAFVFFLYPPWCPCVLGAWVLSLLHPLYFLTCCTLILLWHRFLYPNSWFMYPDSCVACTCSLPLLHLVTSALVCIYVGMLCIFWPLCIALYLFPLVVFTLCMSCFAHHSLSCFVYVCVLPWYFINHCCNNTYTCIHIHVYVLRWHSKYSCGSLQLNPTIGLGLTLCLPFLLM